MQDTPNQIALAEKIIADLGRATTTEAPTSAGTALDVGSELPALLRSRAVRNLSANHSHLDARFMETVSIDLNDGVQRAFEELTGKVGLHVTFDKRFEDAPAGRLTLGQAWSAVAWTHSISCRCRPGRSGTSRKVVAQSSLRPISRLSGKSLNLARRK